MTEEEMEELSLSELLSAADYYDSVEEDRGQDE